MSHFEINRASFNCFPPLVHPLSLFLPPVVAVAAVVANKGDVTSQVESTLPPPTLPPCAPPINRLRHGVRSVDHFLIWYLFSLIPDVILVGSRLFRHPSSAPSYSTAPTTSATTATTTNNIQSGARCRWPPHGDRWQSHGQAVRIRSGLKRCNPQSDSNRMPHPLESNPINQQRLSVPLDL